MRVIMGVIMICVMDKRSMYVEDGVCILFKCLLTHFSFFVSSFILYNSSSAFTLASTERVRNALQQENALKQSK